jgi:hypothetical protein
MQSSTPTAGTRPWCAQVALRRDVQDRPWRTATSALRDERRASGAGQSRSEALTEIMGARRAWTVSMISALSMPCR